MKKIVLIAGKARHGKDTVADIMMKHLPNSEKIAVAYYLKDIATRFFDWNGEKDKRGRHILQYLGTEIIREKIDEDFHIRRLCEDITILYNERDYIFVPDVRFPNEIEVPKKLFGDKVVTIWVDRNKHKHNSISDSAKQHKSENALNNYKFDIYIDNNKDLDYLEGQVIQIIKGWQ